MEELSTCWKKLSLSESEENRIALKIDSKKRDFILAGKFFTRRSLNVEAVAKTFRLLWRTRGGFNVTVGGENILLFAFELEVDVERVIQGELWAFDKYFLSLKNLRVMLLFTRWDLKQQPFGCKFIIYLFPSKLMRWLSVLERLLDL